MCICGHTCASPAIGHPDLRGEQPGLQLAVLNPPTGQPQPRHRHRGQSGDVRNLRRPLSQIPGALLQHRQVCDITYGICYSF